VGAGSPRRGHHWPDRLPAAAAPRRARLVAALAAIEEAITAGASRDQALADGDLATIRDRISAAPR
jgi:hypothetical protein